MKIAVIGAGIGGLAAALRLRHMGHEVTVYEAQETSGGKLSQISACGFRFDAGPSLFTMPNLVEALFDLYGISPSEYFTYKKLDETCRYFFPDHSNFIAWSDKEKFYLEAHNKLGIDQKLLEKYLNRSGLIYEKASRIFLEKSLHKTKTWLSGDALRALVHLPKFKLFQSMHGTNKKMLNGHKKMVQVFDRYATYNGSDPYQASGVLTSIPHLEFNIGAYLPDGGMYTIAESLTRLSQKAGIKFAFNTKVDKIIIKNNQVAGIRYHENEVLYDRVVSNMDAVLTYRHLLPDIKPTKNLERAERSSSALVFYWGVKGIHPKLGLHNILFSADYNKEFKALFKEKICYEDPTVYINITSKHHPGDAPEGHENWFTMINVPANIGQDWTLWKDALKSIIIKKINHQLGIDLTEKIVFEDYMDPIKIEHKTSSWKGSLYGSSSNQMMAAFLRHPNFTSRVKGLYFVGGSVHPGGGIPLCLLSAKIMSENFI